MPNGLNNPDQPTQASWGGYSKWGKGEDNNGYSYTNYNRNEYDVCSKYENYFYPATFNNFSARMDWAKDGKGNINPIIEIDGDHSMEIITKNPNPGAIVIIDASATSDPDGDTLNYKWWIQPEAGTYAGTVNILNSDSNKITINIPSNSVGKNFHIICEVTDDGSPQLTSYRRIIVEPTK